MAYKFNTMPVNSSSPAPSRSSLPNLNSLRRRLLNRTADKETTNTMPPLPQLQDMPLTTSKSSQTPSLPHIPITPPPAPSALKSSPSSIQRASSPAALINSGKNAVDCLKDVVACLDIRTEDGADVSANFEQDLKNMGAQTRKTIVDTVTHLIYKNGSNNNVKKALNKKNCKIVNLLWITDCKVHGKHLSEDKYLIDHPESLLLSATKRRRKCMEPGQVKALKLDKPGTSDYPKTGKIPSFVTSPTHHSAAKRSKQFIDQPSSPSPNANIKRKDVTFHRKPSAIISKETTSSHYHESNKYNALPALVNMDLDDDDIMENNIPGIDPHQQHHQQSTGNGIETMVNKADRSTMHIKSRHTHKHNHPDHSSSPVSQRPQINQNIKAGFYIKSRCSSSSSSSSSSTDTGLSSSPVLRRISTAMTISPSIAIRRRQRPLSNQTTTAAGSSATANTTNAFTSLPPNSPTPTSDAPPSASDSTYLLLPKNYVAPTIVLTSMTTKQKQTCINIIKKLGKYQLASTVNESTTHVIVNCQRRTQSVVLGLIHGVWIVTPDWLLDSDHSCNYLDENDYEATQFFPRAKAARQHDPLLPSTISIYIHSSSMPKDLVNQLVIKGGGQTVAQLHDADIVISNIHLDCTAPIVMDDWLLDSIEQWQYLATSIYAPFSS